MATINLGTDLQADTLAKAEDVQDKFDALANGVNGNLDDANISGISSTKITDSTSAGRSILTAATIADALDALGVPISSSNATNLLINGDFRVAQRGTSFTDTDSANDDDSLTLDRWVLLSDGDDIVDVTQGSDGESIELEVETANKKFGILQVLEQKDALALFSADCSLSFDVKVTGSSITDVRAALLTWSSTADSVTRDVVNSWEADNANPTFETNWTAENTATNLSPTTAWQRVSIEDISVDTASAANVAVFIWMNSIDGSNPTVGDVLHIRRVQLEKGEYATPFAPRPIQQELALCKRYYQIGEYYTVVYGEVGGGSHSMTVQLAPQMRVAPSATVTNNGAKAVNVGDQSEFHIRVQGSAFTTGANTHDYTWTADSEL